MTTGGYVQSYAVKVVGVAQTPILIGVMVSAVAWLVTTLLGGWLSDKYGRIRIYKIGFIVQLVWMFPFFALINTGDIGLIILALILFTVGLGFTYGPQSALYAEMYPANVRYSGAAISYAIGAVLGGAFAPTIAQLLQSRTGSVYPVGIYLAVITAVGLVAAFFVKDRKGVSLGIVQDGQSRANLR